MKAAAILLCALPICAALAQTSESIGKQMASVARQLEAVRAQTELAKSRPSSSTAVSMEPGCATLPEQAVAPLIESASRTHQLQPDLLRAVIAQESAFRPCAISRAGAQGLMQLMPGTAGDLGVENPFDAKQNIDAGARFLKQLLDRYQGNLSQALGAYNAGPSAVDRSDAVRMFPETRDFVKSVLDKLKLTRIDPLNIPTPRPIEN